MYGCLREEGCAKMSAGLFDGMGGWFNIMLGNAPKLEGGFILGAVRSREPRN
jgi:hypothetical protein